MRSNDQRPWVAIVGRPNVGKSTLFNRLLGRRRAIVSSGKGTTRDRLHGLVEWRGRSLTLIDTGGLELARVEGLAALVQANVRRVFNEADGFLLVCDGKDGLLPADAMILERLRTTGRPVVLAVNKLDQRLTVPPEFFSLGVAPIHPISALHGHGSGELLDHLVERFAEPPPPDASGGRAPSADEPMPAVAILGRQNVGKSSLFNALLREERVLVSHVPGTTRDAVDTSLSVDGEPVVLIDTAGLRHRRKVRDPIDHVAMARAVEAIERCDVALVLLDATEGVTHDDQRIISKVLEVGRGLVLVVNKCDLVQGGRGAGPLSSRKLVEATHRAVPGAFLAPVVATSAITGFQVPLSLLTALRVVRAMRRGLSAERCRAVVKAAWSAQVPPRFRGRPIRLQDIRWVPGRPARVELTLRPVAWLPRPYQHYLLKRVYAGHSALAGVPLTLQLRRAG